MNRPRCRRCGGPLDLAWDNQTLRWEWECRNKTDGALADEYFADVWLNLPVDEMKRLAKEVAHEREGR